MLLRRPNGRAWWQRVAATLAFGLLSLQTGCKAEQPWPLWQTYRTRFIEPSGRVVDRSTSGDGHTTSEGMAYGMFFALVVNDRPTFDKLLHWTEDNLAGGDLTARLPSWSWGKTPEGQWKVLDLNSASDADLWMAYDFLEAGRLWHDDRLAKLGQVMLDRIAHSEVMLAPGLGTVLLPGPSGFVPKPGLLILNPSYMPPQVLARLKDEQPTGPWGSIMGSLPGMLRGSSPAGFAMDWVTAGTTIAASGTPAELATGKPGAVPVGSYDAIRVYLWLGMADKDTQGVSDSLGAVAGMGRYMEANIVPPLQVGADGKVINAEGTVGFSAAVIPFLMATGKKAQAKMQHNRLDASVDAASGLYGRANEYYDQNLALFATGFDEGRFRFDRTGRLKLKWK
jgi:endo-1,4-beta-D-glucanase Y